MEHKKDLIWSSCRRALERPLTCPRESFDRIRRRALLIIIPHAVYQPTVLENMPMPWEQVRHCEVIYHINGVRDDFHQTPIIEPIHILAKWGDHVDCHEKRKVMSNI